MEGGSLPAACKGLLPFGSWGAKETPKGWEGPLHAPSSYATGRDAAPSPSPPPRRPALPALEELTGELIVGAVEVPGVGEALLPALAAHLAERDPRRQGRRQQERLETAACLGSSPPPALRTSPPRSFRRAGCPRSPTLGRREGRGSPTWAGDSSSRCPPRGTSGGSPTGEGREREGSAQEKRFHTCLRRPGGTCVCTQSRDARQRSPPPTGTSTLVPLTLMRLTPRKGSRVQA